MVVHGSWLVDSRGRNLVNGMNIWSTLYSKLTWLTGKPPILNRIYSISSKGCFSVVMLVFVGVLSGGCKSCCCFYVWWNYPVMGVKKHQPLVEQHLLLRFVRTFRRNLRLFPPENAWCRRQFLEKHAKFPWVQCWCLAEAFNRGSVDVANGHMFFSSWSELCGVWGGEKNPSKNWKTLVYIGSPWIGDKLIKPTVGFFVCPW